MRCRWSCDNCLLEEPLRPEHVKPRLLGHWGTCPGINLMYAGLNRLILATGASVLLVTGPGHGAPANLANLWLEGSLAEVDPDLDRDRAGLFRLVSGFSWPGGFPSHLNPMLPGVIHEGGELGYGLATAFGAALDNPDLLVACIVGDGEAETGPTATAWHSTKFLDPVGDGAVLPLFHLNGYKVSSPTIFGTMDDAELTALFTGYGWRPWIVAGEGLDEALAEVLDWAHGEIRDLQATARSGRRPARPAWPLLVVRSLKGWTGIDELDGVSGMVNQYAKFLKVARELPWRAPVSSLTYLLTSEGWRQEHNGYSHQGPGFINLMLNKKASVARIYLPPDANTLLATMERCLTSTDSINLVVCSKQPLPQWLSLPAARAHCRAGASEWRWAGSESDDPDVVLAGAGTIPMIETLAAAQLLRRDLPELTVRVVNVVDLLSLEAPADHPHGLSREEFGQLFTADRPVIFNFHGYPSAVHQLVHHRPRPERFHVSGYLEEGTTTTPFDLLAANGGSRYHPAMAAVRRSRGLASIAGRLIGEYGARLAAHRRYIVEHGEDPPEIAGWTWS